MGTIALETARLILRELGPDDLDFVASVLTDPEVMRFWPQRYTRDEARAWIARQQERYARDGFGYWLAIGKTTNEPIGQAGLMMIDVDGVREGSIGYIIHRPFWRRGLATEAAAGCRDYAFDTIGLPRVVVPIRPENEPSLGVVRKLGLTLEKRTVFSGLEHLVFVASRPDRPRPGPR